MSGQIAIFGALAIWFAGFPALGIWLAKRNEAAECKGVCPDHYMCRVHCPECGGPLLNAFALDVLLIIGWVLFWNWMAT